MSESCICLAECIGNACESFIYGVGQIDGCECQLIVHHDVCDSQLQQFAGAKQAVESYQSPDSMSARCPCRASSAGAYAISCAIGKQHAGSSFRSQAECIRQDAFKQPWMLGRKAVPSLLLLLCSGHSGHEGLNHLLEFSVFVFLRK